MLRILLPSRCATGLRHLPYSTLRGNARQRPTLADSLAGRETHRRNGRFFAPRLSSLESPMPLKA